METFTWLLHSKINQLCGNNSCEINQFFLIFKIKDRLAYIYCLPSSHKAVFPIISFLNILSVVRFGVSLF